MIVQDERDKYTYYADGREFMGDRPQGQSKGTSGLNDEFEYYTDRIVDINIYHECLKTFLGKRINYLQNANELYTTFQVIQCLKR